MLFPLLFFLGVGTGVVLIAAHENREGTRPFDSLPPEAKGKPAQITRVTAVKGSGQSYKVSSWRPVNGRAYYIAELVGPANIWIAYWFDKSSGGKLFARGRASSKQQLRTMLDDFNVQATAATESAAA